MSKPATVWRMTHIIPAEKWGRKLVGDAPRMNPRRVVEMTVHYTGAPRVEVSKEQVPQRIKQIERQHQSRPGAEKCATIAYNFVVDKWGRIWEGRGWDYINAANGARKGQPSSNPESFSVLVLVGVKDNRPTPEIVEALQDLYALACKRLRRKLTVQGHRDHVATSCPGAALYRLVRSGRIQSRVGASKTVAKQSVAPDYENEPNEAEKVAPIPQPEDSGYRVATGDTYWSLAEQFLGDGSRWQEISALNGDARLRPGLEIKVPEA